MAKKVLIVDDNQEMLLSLKEGLDEYKETFSVLIAGDGLVALGKLKKNPISLVVTDVNMPRMNGFALFAHINEYYPDIPVIIMTGYGTTDTERQAKAGGALEYIEKPFMIKELAMQIITTLGKESEGGALHGISSGMFLQLMEMEQKTCTVRLANNPLGKQGVLFFREGELLDARVNSKHGIDAAYEIFSWDKVNISIQNVCPQKEKKIESNLKTTLLEAMRLKDEAGQMKISTEKPVTSLKEEKEPDKVTENKISKKPDSISSIEGKLEKNIGKRSGLWDVYNDNSWNGLLRQMASIGTFFNAGRLNLAYIDKGESNDLILLPGQETVLISVNPKCPKEKIIQILTN